MVTVFITVCVVAGLAYIALFGLIARPLYALYAHLSLWLFCPRISLRTILSIAGEVADNLTLYSIVEVVSALAIAVSILRRGRLRSVTTTSRPVVWLVVMFLGSGAAEICYCLLFPPVLVGTAFGTLFTLMAMTSMTAGGIFCLSCLCFVRTIAEVERFLLLFVFSGVELSVEYITFVWLGFFPALQKGAIHFSGRFQGLTFLTFDDAGFAAMLATICGAYFACRWRTIWTWTLVFLPLMPLLGTYQRAPLFALCIGLTVFAWTYARTFLRCLLLVAVILISSATVAAPSDEIAKQIGSALGGTERSDYSNDASIFGRLGIYAAASDVLITRFPFGVGPGLVAYAVAGVNDTPTLDFIPESIKSNVDFKTQYSNDKSGLTRRSCHNIFIEYAVENGMLGVLIVVYFIVLVSRNYRLSRRFVFLNSDKRTKMIFCISHAALAGVASYHLFESTYMHYSVIALLLSFTWLVRRLVRPVVTARRFRMPYTAGGLVREVMT